MIKRILVANRGDIALKIIRICNANNIETVCVYSKIDSNNLFTREADYSICIGLNQAEESYLDMNRIIQVAKAYQCDAIHPGIGFLSESYEFAEAVRKEGIIFIGPSTECMRLMANKIHAREYVRSLGIPIAEGSPSPFSSTSEAKRWCSKIGYPILLKAANGGGGKGMRLVHDENDIEDYFKVVENESMRSFGSTEIFGEKYIQRAKHVEVQIVGDKYGNILHLYERDCSLQRKHQKVIEETPCRALLPELRENIINSAIRIAKGIGYDSVGTIEFLVDQSTDKFYFIEMNTRLQVEHAISEYITGINLIKMQIEISSGESLKIKQEDINCTGHAIECRICAEDIDNSFMPSIGRIEEIRINHIDGIVFETEIEKGTYISPFYDSMIGRVICYADKRETCIKRITDFLDGFFVKGIKTNKNLIQLILELSEFRKAIYKTNLLDNEFNTIGKILKKRICPKCNLFLSAKYLMKNKQCCICGHHFPMRVKERINLICDDNSFREFDQTEINKDGFINEDYSEKLKFARESTGLEEAVSTGIGEINGTKVAIAIMDNHFMMGSMGYTVGEKIARCIEKSIEHKIPLLIFSTSGGARMQEGIISLVQMSKICAVLKTLQREKIFYISCITHPTTGGVCASFSLLGDINIAEPNSLIGFTGRRVIEDTINEKLPSDFQDAEKAQERGFIDMIVDRKEMKEVLTQLLKFHGYSK
ncbi:biotin carboxylase N-terminal domain-containing protein [Paraclostridium bifermentans]|uniref:ATP-binding protein n=1 Tax=Paraclostridium bifermentans TaxID=1490 RepID=UPI00290C0F67|nr:biotin carboxylase N-terminal domain-containing protein [Paraclostridium bifermentans]MDU3338018.1 biotin carboxylase N-terminal domain-containing protein [Paraclostridium bifermentans]